MKKNKKMNPILRWIIAKTIKTIIRIKIILNKL